MMTLKPFKAIGAAACLLLYSVVCHSRSVAPLDYVDPEIGGVGVLLQPTRPTVQIPNQIIRWSPSRTDLLDDTIADFPLTLTSHRQQSVFGFLPFGAVRDDIWTARQEYDRERVTPYGYSSDLEDCSIRFTAAPKSAIINVAYNGNGGFLRFRALNRNGSFKLTCPNELECVEQFRGIKVFAKVLFDADVQLVEEKKNGILLSTTADCITIKYGISYIDAAQAAENLRREIGDSDFKTIQKAAKKSWETALGRIEVEGGSERNLRLFYSSFYRCCERMVDVSEYGRYYSAFDHKVHQSDLPFYTDNWLWDTHISLEPLQTILNPRQEEDKLRSYVEMYKQCGVVPSFATIWGDWPAMTGNYAAVWMADSRAKGLDFDVEAIYPGLRDNSLDATLLPWKNGPRTVLDDFYNENGWYPALWPGEKETVPEVNMPWERRQAVSLSTAFSYCDWAMAQLAGELGKTEDEQIFLKRSTYYKNVYRPDKGMFWPKDKEGKWIEGVDPREMDRAYFTENNAYTFQWDVKHDLGGLFELMGGREAAEKKLDELFRIQNRLPKYQFFHILPDATGMAGQFAMGNEPGFHIPYIYDYLGSPWKTQKHIHHLMDRLFSDTVSGIPGDEDGGGMSSFVVFSMMGFFPVTPGIPVYAIGSPFFEKVSINLPDGRKFTVKAPGCSKGNKYIQSATLNGKPLDKPFFTHEELMAGGTLVLKMGDKPNKEWGTQVDDYCPYVNVFSGTDENGHCHPCACLPFGAIQCGPQTGNFAWEYCGGYQWRDTVIQGFTQNRINGTGSSELGDLLIMPFCGDAVRSDYSSAFSKKTEAGTPGYYRCFLEDYGIKAELSCTPRVAIHKYTPSRGPVKLMVDLQSAQCGSEARMHKRILDCDVDFSQPCHIKGYTHSKAWNDRTIYYDIEFNRPYTVAAELPLRDGQEKIARRVLDFGDSMEPLMVKASISVSSIDAASDNIRTELPDWNLDKVIADAHDIWNDHLKRIEAKGTEKERRVFYTSMYHLMMHPCNIGDCGQKPFYSTLSLWDTYRAAHPLMTIITPEIVTDVANSMLAYYDRQGFLPMWTVSGTDNYGMIGNHSIPVITDAFLKGFKGIEVEALYRAMKQTVTVNHIKCDWEAYDRCGYFPDDVAKVESVSRTLECCYDDWCVAKMAEALGHCEDTAFFFNRSRYWKNLLDPELKLMRSRDSEGKWDDPFDPLLVGHWTIGGAFTEANSWQYTFHVQHDPQGLMAAMGGREAFVAKLDSLFNMKTELHGELAVDVTGMRGQYAHGNEPSHHVIYLYSLAGEQNKAADLIREVWTEQYNDGPAGLSGNDDCGQMSAWYIFSALGFYPVNPCGGEYVLGAPQIPEMSIHLGNGKVFKVVAEGLSDGKHHVASVFLNGKPVEGCTISHRDIVNGGTLRFLMN